MNAADCAMSVAILGNHGRGPITVTIELNTSFIAAAREEDITCTARILRNGRRLIHGLADCRGVDGRLLSHHMLTYARADS
jgi:acyl-coenzyme A thioesterase PaaI-like protein